MNHPVAGVQSTVPAPGRPLEGLTPEQARAVQHDDVIYERTAAHPGAELIAALWRETETELRRCDAFDFRTGHRRSLLLIRRIRKQASGISR